VDLCLDENDGHFIRARLNVSLPGLDHDVAEDVLHTAHQICTYSRATRGNIDVQINLI
jgi:organic hydroperoxide reductase OsmC/OhrA